MAKKVLDSELQFRCDATKKAKAKYICKAKLGMSLSKYLRETIQGILNQRDSLSKKQRQEMLSKISN